MLEGRYHGEPVEESALQALQHFGWLLRMSKRNDFYKDRFASDGVISCGWRIVRRGGRIKVAGVWWSSSKLDPLAGELVHFQVYDYWMEKLLISRGAVGCRGYFCDALPQEPLK